MGTEDHVSKIFVLAANSPTGRLKVNMRTEKAGLIDLSTGMRLGIITNQCNK